LAARDTNRSVRPFDWGLEWLDLAGCEDDPGAAVKEYARRAVACSDGFYSYAKPSDYAIDGGQLTFTSPLETPHPENNTVHADFFPARRDRGRVVLVLPQWNADQNGHVGLCRLLNRFHITALRLTLAYHDRRRPEGIERADYHVSSNVGRTLHAGRQSVVDARACLDWLEAQGFTRLGILGTSLGSCVAFNVVAHDPRPRVAVLNHVSTWFGDVVWTGLATAHVRKGLDGHISQEDLRACWSPISPASYFERLSGRDLRTLLIWARHDTTFLPVFSRQVIEAFRELSLSHQEFTLPCGHYTTGQFPFNVLDGAAMCRYLVRNL